MSLHAEVGEESAIQLTANPFLNDAQLPLMPQQQAGGEHVGGTGGAAVVMPLATSQMDQVIKAALPTGMHVSREAKVAVHKTTTMFLMLMETLISNKRHQGASGQTSQQKKSKATSSTATAPKRAMVNAADVKAALEDAGFGHLVPQLTANKRHR